MPRLPEDSLAHAMHQAAMVVSEIIGGRSLAEGLLERIPKGIRPGVQDMVYTTLRAYGRGSGILGRLLQRQLDVPEVEALLLVAISRLESRPESAHTTVDQAVEAAGEIARGKLRGLCNGVLRSYLRRREALVSEIKDDEVAATQHPIWWLRRLQGAYPETWESIVAADNMHPPMALRVNRRKSNQAQYLAMLAEQKIEATGGDEECIQLGQGLPVERLPGFVEGLVSVQDPGAQKAAVLLGLKGGERVLDACAAPGGKAAHLLERSDISLLALDIADKRCRRIEQNLQRLGLRAEVKTGDGRKPSTWWDGVPFDAILADVPCSASGVVRRHPDAKWLRRDTDIAGFAITQADLLKSLWPCLKVGGKLLYATCSVFPEENQQQIAKFIAINASARLVHEEQLLPCATHDGFYYALLSKLA